MAGPWNGPTSGLIHRWPLDIVNLSGGADHDVVGSINITENGSVTSGFGPTTQADTCRIFNGQIGSYGAVASSPLPTTGAFTLSCWGYTTDNNTQTGGIIPTPINLASNGSTQNCVRISTEGTGTTNNLPGDVYFVVYPGAVNLVTSTAVPFGGSSWAQFGITFDGASTYQLIVNGIAVAQKAGTSGRTTSFNDAIASRDATGGAWNGGLAQLAIYNSVLSAADLVQLYNADMAQIAQVQGIAWSEW